MKKYRRKIQSVVKAVHYDGSKHSYEHCKSVIGGEGRFKYKVAPQAPWVYFFSIPIMPDTWFVSDTETRNGEWLIFTKQQFESMYEEI
jgi:hypothetical protein